MELMKEFPSPNVTEIVPLNDQRDLDFLCDRGIKSWDVRCHPNNIFEMSYRMSGGKDWKGDFNGNVRKMANALFDLHKRNIYEVNTSGLKTGESGQTVGSERFCTMSPDLAKILTNIVKAPGFIDIVNHKGKWEELINVSQYFRFMRYQRGGEHYPHYDSDFHYEYNDTYTRYSLVMYFTGDSSGEIAFVNDNTAAAATKSDWDRQAAEEEIYLKIAPEPLKIVIFPHELCHTVLPHKGFDSRMICRGDLLFKRISQ